MGKRATTDKAFTIPQCGVVKGGRLDGWRFHFCCFRFDGRALKVVARCTPPAWPFFREIGMDHRHFDKLRPVTGDRAKRLPIDSLIETTCRVSGFTRIPPWLINSTLTLRARVKRTHELNERK